MTSGIPPNQASKAGVSRNLSEGEQNYVTRNEERARIMHKCVKKFNPQIILDNAKEIYRDGLDIIRRDVSGVEKVPCDLTPVVCELNKVSGADKLEHEKGVLFAMVRAHHIMTELMWMKLWREDESTRDATRKSIFVITETLKNDKQHKPREAGLRYEVKRLQQAAACLEPASGVWSQFLAPAANGVAAASSLALGSLILSVYSIAHLRKQEWISSWYIDLLPLQWQATNITTTNQFKVNIAPHIKVITENGGNYTLDFVTLLKTIAENSERKEEVNTIVIDELIKLVAKKPEYGIHGAIKHLDQVVDKVLDRPDRYADTRCFAAVALYEIGSMPENYSYRTKIKEVMEMWREKIKDKSSHKYVYEIDEAKTRCKIIKHQWDTLTKQENALKMLLANQSSSGEGSPTMRQNLLQYNNFAKHISSQVHFKLPDYAKDILSKVPIKIHRHEIQKLQKDIKKQKRELLHKLGTWSRRIELANTLEAKMAKPLEALERDELDLLMELDIDMSKW